MVNDPGFTPKEVFIGARRWSLVAIATVVLLSLITLGMWQAGWWFTQQNVNRQAHVTQEGYANQMGQLAALDNDLQAISSIDVQLRTSPAAADHALRAQRASVGNDACKAAAGITISLGKDAPWVRRNCQGGALSPSSPLVTSIR